MKPAGGFQAIEINFQFWLRQRFPLVEPCGKRSQAIRAHGPDFFRCFIIKANRIVDGLVRYMKNRKKDEEENRGRKHVHADRVQVAGTPAPCIF